MKGFAFILALFCCSSLWSATYTVKSGGGGNYTTIQACATAMAAGDTCVVYAGTYNESVTVTAGSVGNYKTITVNGADTVSVLGFTLNSHTKLIGNCPEKQGTVTTASCGFFISNPTAPASAACISITSSATDFYIRDNVLYACGGGGSGAGLINGNGVSYGYLQGNTLSYGGVLASQAGTSISITSFTGTSGTLTFTNSGSNGFSTNQALILSGFTGGNANLNGQNVFVISAGLSSTTFEAAVSGSGYSSGAGAAHAVEGNSIQLNSSSSHILLENNDISHYTLGFCCGDQTYFVIRNNNCHNQYETEAGGNQHTDCFYFSPNVTTAELLIEGNYQYTGVGPNAKGLLNHGEFSPCSGSCGDVLIYRYNTVQSIGSGNTSTYGWNHFKVYNNTYYDIDNLCANNCYGGGDNFLTDTYPTKNSADINNIWYFPTAQTLSGTANPTAFDSASAATGQWGYNLAFCNANGSSNCALYSHLYESGTWTGDTGNILGYANQAPSTNNPNFVNLGGNDFHLSAGSPAIAAGTYLTTVASGDSGSGTSLVVTDASYFQDGYSLSNAYSTVYPDKICVGTVTNCVAISAGGINYSTNTITLANTITRSNGDHIWLYSKSDGVQVLTGSAPDIGAYPYSTSTYSITITSPTNGSANDTASQNLLNCPSTCSTSAASGVDTLTAVPASGYTYGVWGGGTCSGSDATPCAVSGTATVTASFTPIAAAPTFTPPAATYTASQSVAITSSSLGAIICYTTNGTTPATNGSSGCTTGTLYSGLVTISSTETLKAIAGGTGYADGSVTSGTYTINAPANYAPTSAGFWARNNMPHIPIPCLLNLGGFLSTDYNK